MTSSIILAIRHVINALLSIPYVMFLLKVLSTIQKSLFIRTFLNLMFSQLLLCSYGLSVGPVRGVDFHPNQPLFVSGGDDYKIKVRTYAWICQTRQGPYSLAHAWFLEIFIV